MSLMGELSSMEQKNNLFEADAEAGLRMSYAEKRVDPDKKDFNLPSSGWMSHQGDGKC